MKDLTNPDDAPLPASPPRHKPALAERVYHLIYSRISNGDYPANQKLPPEKTLAEEFGVSRPIVRAALERLREQGLVHSPAGGGQLRAGGAHGAAGISPESRRSRTSSAATSSGSASSRAPRPWRRSGGNRRRWRRSRRRCRCSTPRPIR